MSDTTTAVSEPLPELIIPIDEVIFKDKKYTELNLSEPSMKTINQASALLRLTSGTPSIDSTQNYFVKLISGHTGLPTSIVETLPVSICNKAGAYLASFSSVGI